ncbi:venom metalloproteinase antarease-like TtrivMP_A isoform X2 [Rhipicephalus sanguineus]|uniref:venom metalloproteinase antarease-like TtrivMP_A isoform X2 n=1 Tax=Rhipicephalus sanguineus TaxID=34632 RepID=UPI001894170B|nr:venom metalloproteinase antarease-like TtrivMP_A isoform X2 [Rhipicephalus sanguineus]
MARLNVSRAISLSFAWIVAELWSPLAGPVTERQVFPTVIAENSSEGTISVFIDKDIILTLQESSAFASTFRVLTCGQNAIDEKEINLSELGGKVYTDRNTQAVLLISCENGLRVTGFIGGGGRITFNEDAEPSNGGIIAHTLLGIHGNHSMEGFFRDREIAAEAENVEVNARCGTPTSGPASAVIEVVLVVSHEYSTSFTSTIGQEYKGLLDYLRVFLQAVNVILGNTQKDVLDLKLVVLELIVLTEYTEILSKRYQKNDKLIEASTPEPLLNFMEANEHLFSNSDVVVYLSKRNFAMTTAGGYSQVRGMAYAGTACTSDGGVLVADDATMTNGVTTFAHEVLHALGSEHDGSPALDYIPGSPGAVDCPDEKKYIMTKTPSADLLSLSRCTQDQVVVYLNTQQASCLKNADRRNSPPPIAANVRKPFINATRYCEHLHKGALTVEYISVCLGGICRAVPLRPKLPHQRVQEVARERLRLRSLMHKQ